MTVRMLLLLLSCMLAAAPLSAQSCYTRPGSPVIWCPQATGESRLEGHVKALTLNMLLGAATGAVSEAVRGRPVWKGVSGGAGAGLFGYAGKVIVTKDFAASGLIGREVGAVGASMLSNITAGRGTFDELSFPIGPVRLEVTRVPDLKLRTRVDVPSLAFTVYSATREHNTIDWAESLSSGAFVMIDSSPLEDWAGRHGVGVILLKKESYLVGRDLDFVLRHERVHVLQHDFTYHAWGRPAEAWLLGRSERAAPLHDWLDLRVDLLAWLTVAAMLPHEDRPAEREASFLVPIPRPGRITDLPTNR